MSRIESINKIEVYEQNGKECIGFKSDKPCIIVCEHWNRKDFVVVTIGEISVTVLARDLEAAIKNAKNAHSGF